MLLEEVLIRPEHKNSFILCRSRRIDSGPVGKVQESPQILQVSLRPEFLYIFKCRSEICPESPADLKCLEILLHLLRGSDQNIFLYLIIALKNSEFNTMEKCFPAAQNRCSLIQKMLHQIGLRRRGSIDDDNKLLDFFGLAVLVLLHERHIPVQFHPVIVESVVK